MLNTPYYRTLTLSHTLGCDDLPDANYVSYDVFCLETRLYPLIRSLFGEINLSFVSVNENNRMELKIELSNPVTINDEPKRSNIIHLDDEQRKLLQDKINEITSKYISYCLIDINELHIASGKIYPLPWLISILRYINVPGEYLPFYHLNGIYVSFNPYGDFKTAYNTIVNNLLKTVKEYYESGVVYGAGNIAEKWQLKRLDRNEVVGKLFRPMWEDKRFAPDLVSFLIRKIQGNKFIKITITENFVRKHKIALEMNKLQIPFTIYDNYVKMEANNLRDAQYYASIVHAAESMANGKVIIKFLSDLNEANLYVDAANELLNYPECLIYKTPDGYTFSCIINSKDSPKLILQSLEEIVSDKLTMQQSNNKRDESAAKFETA